MTYTEQPPVTDADVWAFLSAGCNAREIADYAAVSVETATAMIVRARCVFVSGSSRNPRTTE